METAAPNPPARRVRGSPPRRGTRMKSPDGWSDAAAPRSGGRGWRGPPGSAVRRGNGRQARSTSMQPLVERLVSVGTSSTRGFLLSRRGSRRPLQGCGRHRQGEKGPVRLVAYPRGRDPSPGSADPSNWPPRIVEARAIGSRLDRFRWSIRSSAPAWPWTRRFRRSSDPHVRFVKKFFSAPRNHPTHPDVGQCSIEVESETLQDT